jgi:isoleucyl-tRNA synthetase
VAIDITVSPELRREGLAREVIRRIQEARKSDGLEVIDRIRLRWFSQDPDMVAALTEYAGLIAREVLAVEVLEGGPGTDPGREHVEGDLGLTFWLGRI